jgi:dTMP kinase
VTTGGERRGRLRGGLRWPGPLRHRPFRGLFSALLLSSFGDWLGFLATTALTTALVDGFTAQTYAISGVLAFRLLPSALLGPLAGAFADRFDRRITMVVSDLLRCALFASIPAVAALADRHTALVWLLVASFLVEALSLFWIPAKEASVPNLLPRRDLESANQLSLVATYGTAPLSAAVFALLGLLAEPVGTPASYLALYVNAATFLYASWQVSRLDLRPQSGAAAIPAGDPAAATPSILASLREGLVFARTSALVRGLLVGMLGTLAAAGAVIALGKPFAKTVLRGGNASYALLFGAVFVGIALGVGLGPKLIGEMSRRRAFGLAIVAAGLGLVLLAVVPNLVAAAVFVLLVGGFAGLAYVVGLTLLGGEVADERRGRMFALVQSLMRIDLLLTLAVAPAISGSIGLRTVTAFGVDLQVNGISVVLLAGGLLSVLVGVLSYRQLDDRSGWPLRRDLWRLVNRRKPPPVFPGVFVAFEGGEGAGKSSQLTSLADWLAATGHEVVVTREPGATPAGERIRALLLDPASELSPRAEALLYAADRAQHVDAVVVPGLARGAVVVTDRYVDSSLAYQGAGRALALGEVANVSRWATQGVRPDLVVLLDVDPRVGLARARRVGSPDRIEAESLAFHDNVRELFLGLANRAPERYLVLDASLPVEQLQAAIRERLLPLLADLPAQVGVPA